jgi:hypothetical protein
LAPSKGALREATAFEPLAGAARAEVLAAQLFVQQLVAMDDANPPLDVRLGREAIPPFAHRFEKTAVRQRRASAWDTFLSVHRDGRPDVDMQPLMRFARRTETPFEEGHPAFEEVHEKASKKSIQ